MIVCHCQNITDREIDAAISWMRASDPDVVITAGKVYRALGKAPDCGGCLPLFLTTLRTNPSFPVPAMDSPGAHARLSGLRRAGSGPRTRPGKGTR
ncbi:MAG: (2Fe-2S)-binding protein [Rhodobacteraceae bacterium]|nr:(2Fe-2S)-binding protein [Paracoccaceae bacterium]